MKLTTLTKKTDKSRSCDDKDRKNVKVRTSCCLMFVITDRLITRGRFVYVMCTDVTNISWVRLKAINCTAVMSMRHPGWRTDQMVRMGQRGWRHYSTLSGWWVLIKSTCKIYIGFTLWEIRQLKMERSRGAAMLSGWHLLGDWRRAQTRWQ